MVTGQWWHVSVCWSESYLIADEQICWCSPVLLCWITPVLMCWWKPVNCGSKSQTTAAHLALARTNIALRLKKPWLLNIDDMYIWLSLPIRWAEWKSVMLSPPDSQLDGGREGRLERRLETPVWDGGVATWGWAEWKIVMPVAVGELERGTLQQHLGDAVDGLCCWDTMSAEVLVHDYQGASKSQWFSQIFGDMWRRKKWFFLALTLVHMEWINQPTHEFLLKIGCAEFFGPQ